MMLGGDTPLLAWLFVQPLSMPAALRFWMIVPLLACVAVVYRATRVMNVSGLKRRTLTNFLSVLVGMFLIAVGFFAAHQLAMRLF